MKSKDSIDESSTVDIIKKLDEWKEKVLTFDKIREEIKATYDGKNAFDFISYEDTLKDDKEDDE